MILVEDPAVEQAMIAFRVQIEDFQNGRSTRDQLKVRADVLMKAFKASLAAGEPIR